MSNKVLTMIHSLINVEFSNLIFNQNILSAKQFLRLCLIERDFDKECNSTFVASANTWRGKNAPCGKVRAQSWFNFSNRICLNKIYTGKSSKNLANQAMQSTQFTLFSIITCRRQARRTLPSANRACLATRTCDATHRERRGRRTLVSRVMYE